MRLAGPGQQAQRQWRLGALFRPDSIYVHLYADGHESQCVRLSVAGLGPEDRSTLAGLLRGHLVPERLIEALDRINRRS